MSVAARRNDGDRDRCRDEPAAWTGPAALRRVPLSAAFGAAISIRQTLLHINPYFDTKAGTPTLEATTNPPFGQAVFGLDLYVWGIILFGTVILCVGIVQLFRGAARTDGREPEWLSRLAVVGVGILFFVVAFSTLTTFLECGFGDCPNDGSWDWWIFR
jgi:hypothetical protein